MIRNVSILYAIGMVILFGACNAPKALFLIHQEEPEAPSKVEFINRSENAENYEWDFGDGTYSVESNPEHRYRRSGTYTVKLKALQGKRTRDLEKEIVVQPPSSTIVEVETDHGTMMIELFDETPLHRDNFIKLVSEGYYDSLLFHRVMQGFMIQGGDPGSRDAAPGAPLGSGGPGYQIDAEFGAFHFKGALSAARTPDQVNPQKRSSGSQFFIVQGYKVPEHELNRFAQQKGVTYTEEDRKRYQEEGGYPPLDGEYTVFGQVVDGLEVIDKITGVETDSRNRPTEDVRMRIYLIQ